MLLRAGLAAGVLVASQEVPAFAEPNTTMCVEVYDPSRLGVSAALQQQIGRYVAADMQVHVQVFPDASAEDISNDLDAEAYAERLANICKWSDRSRLNVLFAYDHGRSSRTEDDTFVINVQKKGYADALVTDQMVDRGLDKLEDKYVDRNGNVIATSDYQQYVADLLANIIPQSGTSGGFSDELEAREGKPIEWPEVPVKPILVTGLTLAILAAGASRIVHGRRLKKLYGETLAASERAAGQAYTGQENAKPLLTLLPDNDAATLRERVGQVDQVLVGLKDSRRVFEDVYEAEGKRWWWPRTRVIRAAAEETAKVTARDATLAASIHADVERIENLKGRIQSDLVAFRTRIAALDLVASSLRDDGWQLGRYQDELAKLNAAEALAAQQIADGFLELPARTIEEKASTAESLQDEIEELPARYDEVQSETTELEEKNITLDAAQITAREVLRRLRQNYDFSCYKDLSHVEARMHELIEGIQILATEAGSLAGQKDVAVIENAEECLDRIAERQLSLEELVSSVYERSEKLETIRREVPNHVREGFAQAGILIDVCAHKDVSVETKNEAQGVKNLLDKINSILMSDARPRYLDIQTQLEDIKNQIEDVKRRASHEKRAAEAARYVSPTSSDNDYFDSDRRTGSGSSTSRRMGGGSSGSSSTRRFGGGSGSKGSSTTRRFGGGR
jgi:uncharacterized membrane protein YgcG